MWPLVRDLNPRRGGNGIGVQHRETHGLPYVDLSTRTTSLDVLRQVFAGVGKGKWFS